MKEFSLRPDHLIRDEVKSYCETLKRWVNERVLPHEDVLDDYWDWTERPEHTLIHDLFKELWIDLGLQKAFIPREYGGEGDWSTVENGAVIVEVARGDFGLACTGFLQSWVVASVMLPKPNDYLMKQLAEWLLGSEPFPMCNAITEPHGGGNVEDPRLKGSAIRTRAKREGDTWVINGHKLWPSAFREAKAFLVICSIEGEQFPNNIGQFIVPADTPGLTTGKPYKKMGAAIDTCGDIWFENVKVPKENKLHEGEDEVKSLIAKETIGRACSTAFAIGIMRRGFEILRSYVENREIGGKPMKEHGVIVHELGQIVTDMVTAESVFWNTLIRLDHPEVYGPPWDHGQLVAASICQNVATECAFKVINRALELMGSYGYAKEGKIEKLFRDVKISQIVVGGQMLRLLEGARYYFGTETI